jgi:hypothetical protein
MPKGPATAEEKATARSALVTIIDTAPTVGHKDRATQLLAWFDTTDPDYF